MSATPFQINLLAAWGGILAGFLTGLALGLGFHGEQWLGGYTSFKRRLLRLGHISLFALGVVNLCFYFTARELPVSAGLAIASGALILGAASMPVCCAVTAFLPRARTWFALPVLSLALGAAITILTLAGVMVGVRPGQPVAAGLGKPAAASSVE
jgi:hypothetical protein